MQIFKVYLFHYHKNVLRKSLEEKKEIHFIMCNETLQFQIELRKSLRIIWLNYTIDGTPSIWFGFHPDGTSIKGHKIKIFFYRQRSLWWHDAYFITAIP